MGKIFNIPIIQVLGFNDRIKTNQHLIFIQDTIDFQDNIPKISPIFVTINHSLYFHESLKRKQKRNFVSIKDNINFGQHLIFTHTTPNINAISQHLTFTQTLIAVAAKNITDKLFFIETLYVNHNQHPIISDTLVFNQHAFAYKIPFNASIKPNLTIDVILTDPITITPRSEVTFTQGDGNAFGLFRPSFGNQYITKYNHIQKESKGRTLILAGNNTYQYKKSIKSLKFKFEYLKEQEADSFLAFLNNNLGLLITVQDHESITYNGIITTPELQIEQLDRNNRTLEFEFEIIPT